MHPFTAKLTVFKILLCVKKLQRILLQHFVWKILMKLRIALYSLFAVKILSLRTWRTVCVTIGALLKVCLYSGLLHILAPKPKVWKSQISKLAKIPNLSLTLNIHLSFQSFKHFSLKTNHLLLTKQMKK